MEETQQMIQGCPVINLLFFNQLLHYLVYYEVYNVVVLRLVTEPY